MKGNRLYKYEKLCSRTAVEQLFLMHGNSLAAYPLRVVYNFQPYLETSPSQFLITIPKKKLRKAVQRVLMRRRIREAYRLQKAPFIAALRSEGVCVNLAFLYMAPEVMHYSSIHKRMGDLLEKLAVIAQKEAKKRLNAPSQAIENPKPETQQS